MRNKVLADTTVWIEFFTRKSDTGSQLENLLKEKSVWTCGVVIFELLQGVKAEEEKILVMDTLSPLPYIEMTPLLWQKSAFLSSHLRKQGITLPFSDILIGAIALDSNLTVYTLDKHFSLIPDVRLY